MKKDILITVLAIIALFVTIGLSASVGLLGDIVKAPVEAAGNVVRGTGRVAEDVVTLGHAHERPMAEEPMMYEEDSMMYDEGPMTDKEEDAMMYENGDKMMDEGDKDMSDKDMEEDAGYMKKDESESYISSGKPYKAKHTTYQRTQRRGYL